MLPGSPDQPRGEAEPRRLHGSRPGKGGVPRLQGHPAGHDGGRPGPQLRPREAGGRPGQGGGGVLHQGGREEGGPEEECRG